MVATLGPFEILSELGRGGMGVVYRARHSQSGQEVALKVALQRLGDRRLARFRREGELTASLQHPGIVGVHSAGELEGRPYLAYELVHGNSLAQVLPGVDLRRRVELIRDVARALGYAHSKGIVHRDVKGENILVDEQGRVRVADFGLAIAADLERLTQTGAMIGTPTHMAPEQVDGKGGEPTAAADVWSLGVILYEALTGELPFSAGTMVELVGLVLGGRYTPPSKSDPDIPRSLEQVCERALSRRPLDRYPNGDALADDLDAWLAGTLKVRRRKAPVWALVATALLLLVFIAGWALSGALREPSLPAAPKRSGPAAPVRPSFSKAELDTARRELARIEGMRGAPQRLQEVRRWLTRHRRLPDEELQLGEAVARVARREFPLQVIDHAPGISDPGLAPATQRAPERGFNRFSILAEFLDDQRLLTYGADHMIRCWDLSDPKEPRWELRAARVNDGDLAVHPSGEHIVICAARYPHLRVEAVRVSDRTRRVVLGLPEAGVVSRMVFTPDGSTLVVALPPRDGGIHFYSWPDLQPERRIAISSVRDLEVSPDGKLLAAVGGPWLDLASPVSDLPNFVRVWDLESGELLFGLEDPRSPQTAVAFTADGRTIFVGTKLGRVYALRLDDPKNIHELQAKDIPQAEAGLYRTAAKAHSHEISAIEIHGDLVLSSNHVPSDGSVVPEIRVWSAARFEELRCIRPKNDASLRSLRLSPDRTRYVIGTGAKRAEIYTLE